jgi:hypothetical protein
MIREINQFLGENKMSDIFGGMVREGFEDYAGEMVKKSNRITGGEMIDVREGWKKSDEAKELKSCGLSGKHNLHTVHQIYNDIEEIKTLAGIPNTSSQEFQVEIMSLKYLLENQKVEIDTLTEVLAQIKASTAEIEIIL